jgi:hypothetical protein
LIVLPTELTGEHFTAYPPEAEALAKSHIALLRQLPLAFLPLLLREVISYDWKFPAERKDLDHQFRYLSSMTDEVRESLSPFNRLRLSPELERVDWVNQPGVFSEQLTAHLWATHQIDAFRSASVDYVHKLNAAKSAPAFYAPRLGIVTVGQGVSTNTYPLFRKLRPYGTYFKNVDPANGYRALLELLVERAKRCDESFAHWYIDGGPASISTAGVACVSYSSLDHIRGALVAKMRRVMQPGGGGPEVLRTMLAQMKPEDLGFAGSGINTVLNHFQISILTEGSGTQLFSTTFVQWSAREVLRRAQPLTLFARFTPRQREESMHELLAGNQRSQTPDPQGSLVDADMGAYYTWVNLQRLPGANESRFLVWFEDHNEALAIGPELAHGRVDTRPITIPELAGQIA